MGARLIQGDTSLITLPVETATAVEYLDIVGVSSGNVVAASATTWATAVATPSAPTVAASAASRGTALTNASTGVKVSVVFPWGEGALSAAGSATPTAAYGLKVTLAACPSPGLGWNVYVEDAAGSGTYKLQQFVPANIAVTIVYVDSYGAGQTFAAANPSAGNAVLSGALQITQYNFGLIYAGISNQRKVANSASIFGNNGANVMQVARGGSGLVVEFDTASASYSQGQCVGMAKDTGNALLNQKVVAVEGPVLCSANMAHNPLAIGKVVKPTTSSTKVQVELFGGIVS